MAIHIKSVRIREGSSDEVCWPRDQQVWELDFPIANTARIGVGYLVEPERFVWSQMPYTLHDHKYSAQNAPDTNRAWVIYEFTAATSVKDVIVIQHANGVVEIDGALGDTPDPNGQWRSLGVAQSRLVGSATGDRIFPEFARDQFVFPTVGANTGRFLKLVMKKTSLKDGWAMYRAYPRNSDGDAFTPASANIVALTSA
ncbi:MAG: hypothetical protein H0V72_20000 [Bradyrhizobium sp.]|nr:hypothetical protein [Bradyrhizobium sp.]